MPIGFILSGAEDESTDITIPSGFCPSRSVCLTLSHFYYCYFLSESHTGSGSYAITIAMVPYTYYPENMKIYIKFIYTAAILSLLVTGCEKDNADDNASPLDGLVKLNEGYASGAAAKIEIWGTRNYFAGYNKLVVVVTDSLNPSQKITDAHIHFEPEMTMVMGMMTKVHAAPVENPDEEAIDGVFPGAVAFIMPTVMDGSWKLKVGLHNHLADKEGEAEFDISVDSPDPSLIKSFVSNSMDSTKLFVSLLEPEKPKVGINDIEFTVHSMETMMSFPAEDGYSLEITPEMPSMGHGSPNNVNPVSTGNGHYKGKVNFTMTGEWRINVNVLKDGSAVSNGLYFEINL